MTPQSPTNQTYGNTVSVPVDGQDAVQSSTIRIPVLGLQNSDAYLAALMLGPGQAPPNAQFGALSNQDQYGQNPGIQFIAAQAGRTFGTPTPPTGLRSIQGAPGSSVRCPAPWGIYTLCTKAIINGVFSITWPSDDGVNVLQQPSTENYANSTAITWGRDINANGNTYVCVVPGTTASSGTGPSGTSVSTVYTDGTAEFLYAGNATTNQTAWIKEGYFGQTAVGGSGNGYKLIQSNANGLIDTSFMPTVASGPTAIGDVALQTPTLANSWTGNQGLAYWRDATGQVQFKGLLVAPSGTPSITVANSGGITSDFVPEVNRSFICPYYGPSAEGYARVQINHDGSIGIEAVNGSTGATPAAGVNIEVTGINYPAGV